MIRIKHLRMKREYENQCAKLVEYEKRFRKIGRLQIQTRALRRQEISNTYGDLTNIIRRGTKSLIMTTELCGLFYKINRCRKMLKMNDICQPRELLL